MHSAIKLVGPGRISKDALDAGVHFPARLLLSDHSGKPVRDLVAALRQIFRHIIKDLSAIVSSRFWPCIGFACDFDSIAHMFPVTQLYLTQKLTIGSAPFISIT